MDVLKKITLIWVSVVMVALFAACTKEGPAESAGKKIDQAAKDLGREGEKMAEVVNDAAITAKVKAAILAESGLSAFETTVTTSHGEVTLTGSADSQRSIDKAKEVAGAVAGVKNVENQLELKPTD